MTQLKSWRTESAVENHCSSASLGSHFDLDEMRSWVLEICQDTLFTGQWQGPATVPNSVAAYQDELSRFV
jgi:hypothetical protein